MSKVKNHSHNVN